eukprot:Opistho-2@31784
MSLRVALLRLSGLPLRSLRPRPRPLSLYGQRRGLSTTGDGNNGNKGGPADDLKDALSKFPFSMKVTRISPHKFSITISNVDSAAPSSVEVSHFPEPAMNDRAAQSVVDRIRGVDAEKRAYHERVDVAIKRVKAIRNKLSHGGRGNPACPGSFDIEDGAIAVSAALYRDLARLGSPLGDAKAELNLMADRALAKAMETTEALRRALPEGLSKDEWSNATLTPHILSLAALQVMRTDFGYSMVPPEKARIWHCNVVDALNNKSGTPLVLCIIYMAVLRRLGVSAYCFPVADDHHVVGIAPRLDIEDVLKGLSGNFPSHRTKLPMSRDGETRGRSRGRDLLRMHKMHRMQMLMRPPNAHYIRTAGPSEDRACFEHSGFEVAMFVDPSDGDVYSPAMAENRLMSQFESEQLMAVTCVSLFDSLVSEMIRSLMSSSSGGVGLHLEIAALYEAAIALHHRGDEGYAVHRINFAKFIAKSSKAFAINKIHTDNLYLLERAMSALSECIGGLNESFLEESEKLAIEADIKAHYLNCQEKASMEEVRRMRTAMYLAGQSPTTNPPVNTPDSSER